MGLLPVYFYLCGNLRLCVSISEMVGPILFMVKKGERDGSSSCIEYTLEISEIPELLCLPGCFVLCLFAFNDSVIICIAPGETEMFRKLLHGHRMSTCI